MSELATIRNQSLRMWLLEYSSPSQFLYILTFPDYHSTNQRGCAAAQCGKALPFRQSPLIFKAAPQSEA